MNCFKKFVVIGFVNTAFAYLSFVFFLEFFSNNVAYTMSYVLSIILSYVLNTVYVFQESFSIAKFFKFPLVYLVQYIFGLILLNLLNIYFGISNYISMLIVIVLSIPLTFFLSKKILKN